MRPCYRMGPVAADLETPQQLFDTSQRVPQTPPAQRVFGGGSVTADEHSSLSHLRAAAHPVRLRIMSLLTGAELSAAEVARELDVTHANASYHLRRLADAGQITVASTETIRGGVAKRYRYVIDDDTPLWTSDELTVAEQQTAYVRATAAELERRSQLVDPDHVKPYVDLETWVEPETWDRVLALVNQAGDLLHAQARPAHSPDTIHVTLTSLAFRMLEEPPA